MFNTLFGSSNISKSVHCEVTGKECSINDTIVLTKIDSVILLKSFRNPRVDEVGKTIYSDLKPPLKYHSEIGVPTDLISVTGRMFSRINDEDDLEQSTAIVSPEGRRLYTGRQIMPFFENVGKSEIVQIPNIFFISVIENITPNVKQVCQQWGINYNSLSKKYRFKKILNEKIVPQTFGQLSILLPGFNVAIGDCSNKNQNGTGYMFKTDDKFQNINLCCNESAVDFCKKNNCLVYYNDFLNYGKLRVLSSYTRVINQKLQNPYLFRSSNI